MMFFGGDAPETMLGVDVQGAPIYTRAFWPGLPFAQTEPGGCTPGIPGGAAAARPSAAVLAAAAALAAGLLVLAPRP